VKLGYKPKVKFNLDQAMKVQRGIQACLHSFFNLGARLGWVVRVTPRTLYLRERDPVSIV
jgi:hypothetical protein